ncbi:MAG TPA: hypothetical protein VHO25_24830 [Polyangiaceae bacterium]|nr:hypothetical protein [Polyangiaceae bacterium]
MKGATTNEQRLKELLKVAERAREVSLPPSMRGRVVLPAEYDAAFADLSRLFDPATCAELVNEVLRLHGENETFRNADYSFMQKIEEQP